MILFRLDRQSGVAAFRQIINQVRSAISLGMLRPGDQLPTVREVVKQIAINPNTVHRAYRELELLGLTEGRTGSGTFVRETLAPIPDEQPQLVAQLEQWMLHARETGLAVQAIAALFDEAIRSLEGDQ
jgi:GntR family transcriptional regulator